MRNCELIFQNIPHKSHCIILYMISSKNAPTRQFRRNASRQPGIELFQCEISGIKHQMHKSLLRLDFNYLMILNFRTICFGACLFKSEPLQVRVVGNLFPEISPLCGSIPGYQEKFLRNFSGCIA